jgi:hypothetical protein
MDHEDALRKLRDLEILNASRMERSEALTEELEALYEVSEALPDGFEHRTIQSNNLLARTVESMRGTNRNLTEAIAAIQVVVLHLADRTADLERRLQDRPEEP